MEEITVEKQIENAIKWIEALLSGKYPQTNGILGNEVLGFCCWGLGCFIVGLEYDPKERWDNELYKHIGFKKEDALITPHLGECSDLAMINDTTDVGFMGIAKYLIKYPDNFIPEVSEVIRNYKFEIKETA